MLRTCETSFVPMRRRTFERLISKKHAGAFLGPSAWCSVRPCVCSCVRAETLFFDARQIRSPHSMPSSTHFENDRDNSRPRDPIEAHWRSSGAFDPVVHRILPGFSTVGPGTLGLSRLARGENHLFFLSPSFIVHHPHAAACWCYSCGCGRASIAFDVIARLAWACVNVSERPLRVQAEGSQMQR